MSRTECLPIKIVLRNEQRAEGLYPLAIRITKNRKQHYDRIQADLMGHKFNRPVYGTGAALAQKFEWMRKVQLKPVLEDYKSSSKLSYGYESY
jgi:hypothetical protein